MDNINIIIIWFNITIIIFNNFLENRSIDFFLLYISVITSYTLFKYQRNWKVELFGKVKITSLAEKNKIFDNLLSMSSLVKSVWGQNKFFLSCLS